MSLKLVPESKNLHKSFTVIFGVILLVTSIAQALATSGFLESVKPLLSPETFAIVSAGFSMAIIIGRYAYQTSVLLGIDLKPDGKINGEVKDE